MLCCHHSVIDKTKSRREAEARFLDDHLHDRVAPLGTGPCILWILQVITCIGPQVTSVSSVTSQAVTPDCHNM